MAGLSSSNVGVPWDSRNIAVRSIRWRTPSAPTARFTITCRRCSHYRIMWAYKIYIAKNEAASLPLEKTVPGFWCKGCRRSVSVFMKAGEFRN